MTIVATIVTSRYTAHACDSFLTIRSDKGKYHVIESTKTKLVRVEAWRGAIAYWGLASFSTQWDTLNWLRRQALGAGASKSAEEFAQALAGALTSEAKKIPQIVKNGLGIHFSAYEPVNGYMIPELFLITNYINTKYLTRQRFAVTRETYATLNGASDRPPDHAKAHYRMAVHDALRTNHCLLQFNNGDTALFNPVAVSIFSTVHVLSTRQQLRGLTDVQTGLALVKRPIEIVSKLLTDLAKPQSRLVGGKPHNLAITPKGEYHSTTGD